MKNPAKLILIFCLCLTGLQLRADIDYVTVSTDYHSRYVFRGFSLSGEHAGLALNATLGFKDSPFQLTQWYCNSLGDWQAYHESGTMLNYFYPLNENLFLSGGAIVYLKPDAAESLLFSAEAYVILSGFNAYVPWYAESYVDPVYGSWYNRLTGAYTLETILPIQFSLSCGANFLPYQRGSLSVPAGFSDLTLKISSYLAVPFLSLTPELAFHVPLQPGINTRGFIPAFSLNLSHTFIK